MVLPTLGSNTEYLATINQIFEQDNSYLCEIRYDEGKEIVLKSIDLITMLLKKKIQKIESEEKMLESLTDTLQKIFKLKKRNQKL